MVEEAIGVGFARTQRLSGLQPRDQSQSRKDKQNAPPAHPVHAYSSTSPLRVSRVIFSRESQIMSAWLSSSAGVVLVTGDTLGACRLGGLDPHWGRLRSPRTGLDRDPSAGPRPENNSGVGLLVRHVVAVDHRTIFVYGTQAASRAARDFSSVPDVAIATWTSSLVNPRLDQLQHARVSGQRLGLQDLQEQILSILDRLVELLGRQIEVMHPGGRP